MVNETEEERGLIQDFFAAEESFREPPVFLNDVYPAFSIADQTLVPIRLIISFLAITKRQF